MSKIPTDRRVVRTKKMIRNALAELIEEKGFNNISITDITTRADINRGTFYLHYYDKYDLLKKIEDEVLEEIQNQVKSGGFDDALAIDSMINIDSMNKPISFIIKIFEYFKENSTFMKAILGPNGDPKFQNNIKIFMETNLFDKQTIIGIKKENLLIPKEYFISYVLSAHLGVLQQWLGGGMKESPEEMALILEKMFLLGAFRVTGLKSIADLFNLPN